MFKKLGELFAAFKLGKQLSIEQELQSAEAWEKVTAQNIIELKNKIKLKISELYV